MKTTVELPFEIGQEIYMVRDYNCFHDKCDGYVIKNNGIVVIESHIVEGFIIDEDGIFAKEGSHGGDYKLGFYENITLSKGEKVDVGIFDTFEEALKFVRLISDDGKINTFEYIDTTLPARDDRLKYK